jgi:hypothetical protein
MSQADSHTNEISSPKSFGALATKPLGSAQSESHDDDALTRNGMAPLQDETTRRRDSRSRSPLRGQSPPRGRARGARPGNIMTTRMYLATREYRQRSPPRHSPSSTSTRPVTDKKLKNEASLVGSRSTKRPVSGEPVPWRDYLAQGASAQQTPSAPLTSSGLPAASGPSEPLGSTAQSLRGARPQGKAPVGRRRYVPGDPMTFSGYLARKSTHATSPANTFRSTSTPPAASQQAQAHGDDSAAKDVEMSEPTNGTEALEKPVDTPIEQPSPSLPNLDVEMWESSQLTPADEEEVGEQSGKSPEAPRDGATADAPSHSTTPSTGKEKAIGQLAPLNSDRGLTPEQRLLVQDAVLEASMNGDEFASHVHGLLRNVIAGETLREKPVGGYGLQISNNQGLFRDDLCSLYCVEGGEAAAWYTDAVINTLLDIEAALVPDVYIERNLFFWLESGIVDNLDDYIENAKLGREPAVGWPFIDLTADHSRILFVMNPSGAHWVTVEILHRQADNAPEKLIYYNSMSTGQEKDPTYRAATEIVPKLLYLASLRPGSLLAGCDPHRLEVEEARCPQQVGDWDCGPFSLYFLTCRLYDQAIAGSEIPLTQAQRCAFGGWLRKGCAAVLYNKFHLLDKGVSLKEAFANPGDVLAAPRPPPGIGDFGGSAPPSFAMVRLELNKKEDSVATMIIVLRWSSTCHFWTKYYYQRKAVNEAIDIDVFKKHVTEIARHCLAVYCQSTRRSEADTHVIVFAGTHIPTRLMPHCDNMSLETIRDTAAPADYEPGIDDLDEEESRGHITVACPLCNDKWVCECSTEGLGKAFVSLCNHVGGQHMPDARAVESTASVRAGKVAKQEFGCTWEGCEFTSSASGAHNAKRSVRRHAGRKHLKALLDAKGKQMVYTCDCSDPACRQQWTDLSKLKAHLNSIETNTIRCLHCPATFSRPKNARAHQLTLHWKVPAPDGWYMCDEDIRDNIAETTWKLLNHTIKLRLLQSSNYQCPWNEVCSSTFTNTRALEQHCKTEHADELLPFTLSAEDRRCGELVQSQQDLDRHKSRVHGRDGRKVKDGRWDHWHGPRTIEWTQMITRELTIMCQGPSRPVLLSNGMDGFTCNTELLSKWLQQVNLDFTLDIVADGVLRASLESHILLQSLLDRAGAPEEYATVLDFWDRQQAAKDEHSAVLRPRNTINAILG